MPLPDHLELSGVNHFAKFIPELEYINTPVEAIKGISEA